MHFVGAGFLLWGMIRIIPKNAAYEDFAGTQMTRYQRSGADVSGLLEEESSDRCLLEELTKVVKDGKRED